MSQCMNILVVSTLYPNAIQFRHGVFVENRIRHLIAGGEVAVKVIAPVAWFPVKSKFFPEYSRLVDIPSHEVRHGIDIYHPRYIVIPKIGMLITPLFLAFSIYRQILKLRKQGNHFDAIDAHYYYPDGVAAAMVAKWFNIPLTITARGTDINLIADFAWPRKMIVWASRVAQFNLAVCEALRQKMVAIGIAADTSRVFRNGVDLTLFKPLPRDELKRLWQVKHKLLLSVGYLIERKGHHLLIEALADLPEYELFIIGDGEWRDKLKAHAEKFDVQHRVRFLGEIPQQQLPDLYNCADALVLASSREGWANVLLEAMACGTPVVATNIWGTPEVVRTPEAGVLCESRSPEGIANAVKQLFSNYPDRSETRRYAEQFSWRDTTEGLVKMFKQIHASHSAVE